MSSTEAVEVTRLSESSLVLRNTSDLRTSDTTIGGLARKGWVLAIGQGEESRISDKSRTISFKVPPAQSATVERKSPSVLQ